MFYIQDTLANKISYYYLLLFLVCLPFDRFYAELVFISFGIHTLLHIRQIRFSDLPFKKMLLVQSIFLLTVSSLWYAYDSSDGYNKPARQLAFFVFPILFALTRFDLRKYKQQLQLAFSIVCTLTVVYLYYDALHTIYFMKLPLRTLPGEAFINMNFTEPIDIHPTYFSMYCCFSLLCMIHHLLHTNNFYERILCVLSCALLTAALIQLGSRAVLIAAIICINGIVPFMISSLKLRWKYLAISITTSALIIVAVAVAPALQNRYVKGFKKDLQLNATVPMIPEPRIERWRSAMTLINRSPVIGYGTGAETPVLQQQYFSDKLYMSYYAALNAHNEYLSIALNSGYTGLAIFLCVLVVCFRFAFAKKDWLFLGFLSIIAITSFSENILDLNKGIFFIAFFLSLFLMSYGNDKTPARSAFSRA